MAKEIIIKSYTAAGVFVNNLQDATFDSFSKSVNGGLGDMTFRLSRKLDNFNVSGDVALGNRIDVWVFDEDSGNSGLKIYSGYIEQHNPGIDGGTEMVEILCKGVITQLNADILKSSNITTLYTDSTTGLKTSASSNAAEVGAVVRAGIDLFIANNPSIPFGYDNSGVPTVETTGVNLNYKFVAQTYFDFLRKCLEAAPANWYFYVGADNILKFKAPAIAAEHTFLLTKDIKSIRVQKGVDSVKNILLLYDGNLNFKQYSDAQSITQYRRRVQVMTDDKIQDTATMDAIGAAFIAENKDARTRITLEIIDNNESEKGYNIEAIEPGQTCRITGITASDLFTENMQITNVDYKLDRAILTLETRPYFDLNNFIVKLRKDVDEEQKENLPGSYT